MDVILNAGGILVEKKAINKGDFFKSMICILLGIIMVSITAITYVVAGVNSNIELGRLEIIRKYASAFFLFAGVCFLIFGMFLVYFFKVTKQLWNLFIPIIVVVGGYLITFLFMYFIQDGLIQKNNLVFNPSRIVNETSKPNLGDWGEEINFKTADNIDLHGWIIKNSKQEKAPLILYFGGGEQDLSQMPDFARGIDGWNVAMVDYRGYGSNGGIPSEEDILQDSLLVYDQLSKRTDIDNTRIVPMGMELGSCFAAQISKQRPVKSVILVSPFESYPKLLEKKCHIFLLCL